MTPLCLCSLCHLNLSDLHITPPAKARVWCWQVKTMLIMVTGLTVIHFFTCLHLLLYTINWLNVKVALDHYSSHMFVHFPRNIFDSSNILILAGYISITSTLSDLHECVQDYQSLLNRDQMQMHFTF